MRTGDNLDTATAIARKIGLLEEDEVTTGKVCMGLRWAGMSQQEREDFTKNGAVLVRVEPLHMQQLVKILQDQGHGVASTGDGVNNAPALKAADISLAMGSGTNVAQYAATVILADDSFSIIVATYWWTVLDVERPRLSFHDVTHWWKWRARSERSSMATHHRHCRCKYLLLSRCSRRSLRCQNATASS
jgi:hypothetical protein